MMNDKPKPSTPVPPPQPVPEIPEDQVKRKPNPMRKPKEPLSKD